MSDLKQRRKDLKKHEYKQIAAQYEMTQPDLPKSLVFDAKNVQEFLQSFTPLEASVLRKHLTEVSFMRNPTVFLAERVACKPKDSFERRL